MDGQIGLSIGRTPVARLAGPCAWAFANGLLLAFAVVFYIQFTFVSTTVHQITSAVVHAKNSPEQNALALMREANAIMRFGTRHGDPDDDSLPHRLPLRSFDEAFLNPGLACGDAAAILYRLLDDVGIRARLAQMRCGTHEGCHIVVEAVLGGRWVVLDPLYGVAFRDERGALATFAEISADWPWFSRQVPPGYKPEFRYEGVRYTNWEKIPVLMPLARRALVVLLGEERTSQISLRRYAMTPNRLYCGLCVAGLVVVNAVAVALVRRRRGAVRAAMGIGPARLS